MSLRSKLEQLIKAAKDYDPDKRYMAASDLCAELLKEQEDIDVQLQRHICGVFLEHLDDLSVEVQGNAVRCIKRTVSKIHESQVSEVITKLGQCLTDGKPELIDIYSTCLKGLIGDVPDSYSSIVSDTMLPILLNGIKSPSVQLQEEATDTLTELLKRFAHQMQGNTDRSVIINSLTRLLLSEKPSVRKKATQCIGAAAVILPANQLQNLVSLVIERIRGQSNSRQVYTFVQCLSAISRSVGYKLSSFLDELIPLLLPLCDVRGLSIDSADIEYEHEKIEVCLAAIESLVRRCPKEITRFVGEIHERVIMLISYDPNYSYDEPMEEDEDWGSDFEGSDAFSDAAGDDSSWKVRRASIHVIESIIKTKPESYADQYDSLVDLLMERFKEREENVKLDVFKTFSALFKSLLISLETMDDGLPSLTRTRSSAAILHTKVPEIVQAILKEYSTKNLKVRQGLTQLLHDMTQSLPEKMTEQLPLLMPELVKNLEDRNNSNLRMDTLVMLERLLRSGNRPDVFEGVADALLPHVRAGIADDYFKISAQSLKIAGAAVRALPGNSKVLNTLVPEVINRLAITDIDQEVKQASIFSISVILAVAGDRLDTASTERALRLINERLRNEVTRLPCLKAWKMLAEAQMPLSLDSNRVVEEAVEESVKLLKKNQRALKVSVLESLLALLKRFPVDSAGSLTAGLAEDVSENDLHISQYALEIVQCLTDANPRRELPNLNDIIREMNALARSRLVQGGCLQQLTKTYGALVKHGKIAPQDVVSSLNQGLDALNRHSFESIARCIAAACLAGPAAFCQSFLTQSVKVLPNGTEASMLAALCIGEIGKEKDLSGSSEITESIIALFDQGNEDVKVCASVALGSLAVGNLNVYLNIIFKQFAVASHKYLLLISLKEVISHHFTHMEEHINTILPILLEHANNPEESVRSLVSECLGKLFLVAPEAIGQTIETRLNSGNELSRTTVATSIKYAANNKAGSPEHFQTLVPSLINCLPDYDVNLKRAALISINAIVHNLPVAIRHEVDPLLDKVYPLTAVNHDLIRKVDLGPFVHQIDDGLVLRKAAFSLIETLLEHLPEKVEPNVLTEYLINGLDDISEEIQIQALQTLCKLIGWGTGAVLTQMERLVNYFKKTIAAQLKAINSNQEVERANDMLRACFRCVDALVISPDFENALIHDLVTYIESIPELANIMHAIKRQRESWFSS